MSNRVQESNYSRPAPASRPQLSQPRPARPTQATASPSSQPAQPDSPSEARPANQPTQATGSSASKPAQPPRPPRQPNQHGSLCNPSMINVLPLKAWLLLLPSRCQCKTHRPSARDAVSTNLAWLSCARLAGAGRLAGLGGRAGRTPASCANSTSVA